MEKTIQIRHLNGPMNQTFDLIGTEAIEIGCGLVVLEFTVVPTWKGVNPEFFMAGDFVILDDSTEALITEYKCTWNPYDDPETQHTYKIVERKGFPKERDE